MVEVNCAQCNKSIHVFPRTLERSKTGMVCCSRACRTVFMRGKPLVAQVAVTCSTCGGFVNIRPGLSRSMKRFFCSETCKQNYDMIDVSCVQCKKIVRRRRVEVAAMKHGPFCSRTCHGKWKTANDAYIGERNPAWKGGYSSPNYNYDWKRQRAKARKRDNYACQDCGTTQQAWGYALDVHHIVPYDMFEDSKEANAVDNLVTLCRICHVKRHIGESITV